MIGQPAWKVHVLQYLTKGEKKPGSACLAPLIELVIPSMNLLILNVVIVTSRVQICLWGDLSHSFILLVLPQIDILRSISSQFHVVLLFPGGFSHDAWVRGQYLWLSTEGVCWSCHKLAFVVGTISKLSKSIMNNHYFTFCLRLWSAKSFCKASQ